MKIIADNSHFVLVDKPSGMLTVPGRTGAEDPRPCLGWLLQKQLNCQLFPVHRLDFEVSGLVLFAKNAEAHRESNLWFEKRLVHKFYSALSPGFADASTLPQKFEWKSRLLRGKKRAYESPVGKPALTKATLLKSEDSQRLRWRLEPVTGRPHQLRYEMAKHGFAILGDQLYGSQVPYPEGIALRAVRIEFPSETSATRFDLKALYEIEDLP